jgi:hypothetical protein
MLVSTLSTSHATTMTVMSGLYAFKPRRRIYLCCFNNVVAFRSVARQQQRNVEVYNGRYQEADREQQQRNGASCAVRAEML